MIHQFALLLAAALHGTAAPAPAFQPPALRAGADTADRFADSLAVASVSVTIGDAGSAPVPVRDFDFTLSGAGATGGAHGRESGEAGATAQVRFAREPDALSADLARRVGSGARIALVEARLERGGAAPIVLRLYDVRVASVRLLVSGDDMALTQQRLGLDESIAQLSAEQGEADRQLAAIESLAKQRLSPPLELARVRSNAELVGKRLAAQRHRLAIVQRQLARRVPIQEEVVLTAARAELTRGELSEDRD